MTSWILYLVQVAFLVLALLGCLTLGVGIRDGKPQDNGARTLLKLGVLFLVGMLVLTEFAK